MDTLKGKSESYCGKKAEIDYNKRKSFTTIDKKK